jgi:lysophospholipase L1-like esterase
MTKEPRKALAHLAGNLGLALLSGLLCLIAVELALTLVGYEYTPLQIEVVPNADARPYHVFEDHHFVYDADLIWRPKPSYDMFNAQGFRGVELPASKPASSYRVFAVGDSNTLGWAGEDGPNWPEYLGELLQARAGNGREIDVINAGVWGYSSYQGVLRFRETLPYEPDMVLISFGGNDAHLVGQADRDYSLTAAVVGSSSFDHAVSRLRVGQLLFGLLSGFGRSGNPSEMTRRVTIEEYRDNLRTIVQESREAGVEVVLLTRPYIGEVGNPLSWKAAAADYGAATVDVAREMDVTVIDVYSLFREQDALFDDESHFTEEGHRLAARLIFDVLRTIVPSP